MSNDLLVGIKIGATLTGGFQSVLGSAKSTLGNLGKATEAITKKQDRLGATMARAMAHPTRNIAQLNRQYQRLGTTLKQLQNEQRRLNDLMSRQKSLRDDRRDLRGRIAETIGVGVAFGAPVYKSVVKAAQHQDQIRDIGITGGFTNEEELSLSKNVRENALRWNQTTNDINQGLGVLVAGGISTAKELEGYSPILAKTATATRASMEDLGNSAIALKNSMGIEFDGIDRAFNIMASGGKDGQFELADQAKWLPQLAPALANLGMTGEKGLAQGVAMLQIARKGASTSDSAGNNVANLLGKLTSQDTIKAFEDAGIDIKKSMRNIISEGRTAPEAMIGVIQQYLGTKGPEAAKKYTEALSIADDKERDIAVSRLNEAYKLSELFRDRQVLDALRPMLAHYEEFKQIELNSLNAADAGVTDTDFGKRMESPVEQFKAFKILLDDIGITIGEAVLPGLISFWESTKPVVLAIGEFAKANPSIIAWTVGIVGAGLGMKLFAGVMLYGISMVRSLITSFRIAHSTIRAWRLLVSSKIALGSLSSVGGLFVKIGSVAATAGKILMTSLLGGLKTVGTTLLWLGRALLMNPIGLIVTAIAGAGYLIYRYWTPIKSFFVNLWADIKAAFNRGLDGVKKLLNTMNPMPFIRRQWDSLTSYFSGLWSDVKASFSGGIANIRNTVTSWRPLASVQRQWGSLTSYTQGLWSDIKSAFDGGIDNAKTALGWTPLGLVINNWSSIKGYASELWSDVKASFSGGIDGLKSSVLSWSPISDFTSAFNSVFAYFSSLSIRFTGFGSNLMQGLINGIKGMAGAVYDSIANMGTGVVGWFKEKLGINSPSRVFMTLGHGIGEGAALGIGQSSRLTNIAVNQLATDTFTNWDRRTKDGELSLLSERIITLKNDEASSSLGKRSINGSGDVTINFHPNITVNGESKSVKQDVQEALKISMRDFEAQFKRMVAAQSRRSYSEAI